MNPVSDYLLSYGMAGDFGRFFVAQPATLLQCRRGDRAVIRTARGLELGTVLCATLPGHARHLPNTSVGQLLRLANPHDVQAADRMRERGREVFEDGRRSAAKLGLPLEVLDVEVLLDGQRAVIYHVHWAVCDVRPFVSELSTRHGITVQLHDLSRADLGDLSDLGDQGCGRPNCGQGKGGCDSCKSSGGCGSCGAQTPPSPADLQAHFAQLREQMIARNVSQRTPLL